MDGLPIAIDTQSVSYIVLAWIGQALVLGTILAACTWLVARLMKRRMLPAVEAALWSIVLLKFLVPVGPLWTLPLADALSPDSSAATQFNAIVSSDSSGFSIPPLGLAPHSFTPTFAVARDPATASPHYNIQWFTWIAVVYAASVAALFVCRRRGYRKLVVRCRALPLADDSTRKLVADVCRRLGVRRVPSTRVDSVCQSPFIIGISQPLLVLSPCQFDQLTELEAVIIHEVAHLRRRDLVMRSLQWVAGLLLFFWPVITWVNRRIDTARECACDQWALSYGKLAPGEYARCLLSAARWSRSRRLTYQPTGMATNLTTIERRIDMILQTSNRPSETSRWRMPTLVACLAWGGLVLGGAVTATPSNDGTWPATEESVKDHAALLYQEASQRPVADFNGDGILSYIEKDGYLVAKAMGNPVAFMARFPYADRNHSGALDILEAYDTIRGVTLIAYADRRPQAGTDPTLDYEFCHMALGVQQWLLDTISTEPEVKDLDNIWSILVRVQGSPNGFTARMLDNGGPQSNRNARRSYKGHGPTARFHELEANITDLKARLANETDPHQAELVEVRLERLATILDKLGGF